MLRRQDPLANPEPLIRRVYSYAAYRLGDGPDAEDATSETFERAVRYRRSYDAGTGNVQAWLLGIARRVVDDQLAQARTRATAGPPPDIAEDGDVALRATNRLALRGVLGTLSQSERDLLALRYGAGLTARDIALVTGGKTNAIEVALHRLLAKLRAGMNEGASV
jgi:RNA polymerase sigma factor (sigma-70 family)